MSNRVTLEPTEFRNIGSGESTWGYRLYDDYSAIYNNFMTKEEARNIDGMKAWELIKESDATAEGAGLYDVVLNNGGFFLGDEFIKIPE